MLALKIGISALFGVCFVLPTSVYLCMKWGTIGYWTGFLYCAKTGIVVIEEHEEKR